MSENESYTLDAEEQKRRIAERKKKQLEAEDFTTTPEEQEEKKRSGEPTEIQGHEDGETKYDPESEDLDENYPIVEGKKRLKKASETETDEQKSPLQ